MSDSVTQLVPGGLLNLTLHCPAHNALEAERDFGTKHMIRHRDALQHETRNAALRAGKRLSEDTG